MISVHDETNTLSADEQNELGMHCLRECYSTPVERRWLKLILLRDEGANNRAGFWHARANLDKATRLVLDIEAVIGLNRHYLHDIDDLKDTLSHEYGHHVTLCYLMRSRNLADSMSKLLQERVPVDYYRARNIENVFTSLSPSPDTKGWDKCDKEILAEDYRVLFTSSKSPHRMASAHGFPSEMVRDWIWHLFHHNHVGGGWHF